MIERIGDGILRGSRAEVDAAVMNREIRRLGSISLGPGADFYGTTDASVTMPVPMTAAEREDFMARARASISKQWKERHPDGTQLSSEKAPLPAESVDVSALTSD